MTMHGRNKTGALRDDEIKKEMRGELQANRALRVEEDHELQPSGEDQPEVGRDPEGPLGGAAPPGMTSEDVASRAELARYLGRGLYPADRDGVLDALRQNNAPDRLLELGESLPGGETYANVQEIARALGLGVEDHRT